jgi:aspartyl-tRNA(Asn)/glutamyl-tRNA(Gln) amidotransferase subunit C
MAVTRQDVLHVAALARLGMTDARADSLVAELNTILAHMDVLAAVDTERFEPVAGVGADGMPLRPDVGPAVTLGRTPGEFAPEMRDGFFLVPRLATHDGAEEG